MKKVGNFGFLEGNSKLFHTTKLKLAKILPNTALNHFLEGFEQGGYQTDASQSGWPKRKRMKEMKKRGERVPGQVRSVTRDRALLVKTGTLRRSLKVTDSSPNLMRVASRGVRYASIHNFGLLGKAWGKWPFKMPKREFVGKSKELELKLNVIITRAFKKYLDGFAKKTVSNIGAEKPDTTVNTGKRGGKFTYTASGKKRYLKK